MHSCNGFLTVTDDTNRPHKISDGVCEWGSKWAKFYMLSNRNTLTVGEGETALSYR
jgi:hypothetical protein